MVRPGGPVKSRRTSPWTSGETPHILARTRVAKVEPGIELERFARLSAELDAGAARDGILEREGLSLDAWTAAQEAWLKKLADEASRKRFALTNRYNKAFVARRREIESGARGPA